jgi:MFS family permease
LKREAIPIYLFSFFMIMPFPGSLPVLPAIRDEIRASYSQIAFFLAIVGFARVLFAIPSGFLADRFNRKTILVLSGCLCIAGLILLSISHNIYQLILSRFIIGTSSIVSNITILVLLAKIAGSEKKGAMLSMNNVVHYAGAIASPAIVGILTAWYNWRIPFIVIAAMILVSIMIFIFNFHEQSPEYKVEKNVERKMVPPPTETGIKIEAFKLLPVFIISLFVFFYRGSFQHTLIPFYGKDVFHLSVESLGFYISLMSIIATICIFILGLMSDRYGRKKILIPALFVSTMAVLALMLPKEINPLMITCILVGIGAAISSMPNIIVSDLTSPGSVGKVMGVNRIFADSGYFLGTLMTGALLDHFGFRVPLYVLVGFAGFAVVVTIFFVPKQYF